MDNIFLEYLDAYKKLDSLCKQLLSDNKGISEYIKQMQPEIEGFISIPGWKNDYNQLKRLRHIRNQLVHDPNSFHNTELTRDDIEWLVSFCSRILDRTDPLSLLYNQRNKRTNKKQKNSSTILINSNCNNATTDNNDDDDINLSNRYLLLIFLLIFIVTLLPLLLFYLYYLYL